MSYTKLPTYIEVYNHNIFIKTNDSKSAKNETIQRLLDIWTNACLPTQLTHYIKNYHLTLL